MSGQKALRLEFLLADLACHTLDDEFLAGRAVSQFHMLLQVALPEEGRIAQVTPVVAHESLLPPLPPALFLYTRKTITVKPILSYNYDRKNERAGKM